MSEPNFKALLDQTVGAGERKCPSVVLAQRLTQMLKVFGQKSHDFAIDVPATTPLYPIDEATVARELVDAHAALQLLGITDMTATDLMSTASICWGDQIQELLWLDGSKILGPEPGMKWVLLLCRGPYWRPAGLGAKS
jgi:hypothetical protein